MCTCISKMQKDLIGKDYHKKKIQKATLVSASIFFTGEVKTTSDLELELEGVKKIYKTKAIHDYCPFCGEKYPKKS